MWYWEKLANRRVAYVIVTATRDEDYEVLAVFVNLDDAKAAVEDFCGYRARDRSEPWEYRPAYLEDPACWVYGGQQAGSVWIEEYPLLGREAQT